MISKVTKDCALKASLRVSVSVEMFDVTKLIARDVNYCLMKAGGRCLTRFPDFGDETYGKWIAVVSH